MPRAKVIKEPVYKRQKTAQIYQQSFWGADGRTWFFQFSRIYKSRPENKLIIRVIQCIAGLGTETKDDPIIVSLTNAAEINGKCNQYYNNSNLPFGQSTTSNPFILGICGSPAHQATISGSPSIVVNDLPLNQMNITLSHLDTSTVSGVNYCFVVFEIEEIEEV
jgi:hypothetical protein